MDRAHNEEGSGGEPIHSDIERARPTEEDRVAEVLAEMATKSGI